jgi:hypothetical protein
VPLPRLLLPALALATGFIALGAASSLGARPVPVAANTDAHARREVARIQTHFDSVLTELAASTPRDVRIAGAHDRRAALIRTLRAYRDAGVFPHNYDFPGQAVPYFVDRRTGTRCAVAHLLAFTGRRDIVDRVARTNNNVWVAELAGDSAFTAWLEQNGITLAEAARIQVPYMEDPTPAQQVRNNAFLVAAPVALGTATVTSLINALGNADGHRRVSRIAGLASGVATAGLGAAMLTRPGTARQVGMASVAVGGLSIALATRATQRHNAHVAQQREAERARAVQATLSPIIGTGGAGSGISLAIRY